MMDREGFRNRMKQYKEAKGFNPLLKYWEWKQQYDTAPQPDNVPNLPQPDLSTPAPQQLEDRVHRWDNGYVTINREAFDSPYDDARYYDYRKPRFELRKGDVHYSNPNLLKWMGKFGKVLRGGSLLSETIQQLFPSEEAELMEDLRVKMDKQNKQLLGLEDIPKYNKGTVSVKEKENLLLQKLEKTAELYDIPKIKDKEITLSNAGSMTGAVLSTNMLDSIYKYSNITNLPLVEAIGLPAQESAFGKWRRINGNAYWNSSENRDTRPDKITSDWEYTDPGILQYINSSRINAGYKNSELEDSVLLWDNAKDMDRRDLLRLRANVARLKGEAEYIKSKQNDINKIFESFSIIPPLQHAYEYYKTGKYNPGDSSHKQDVIRKGKEVMNSPEFKKWAKENGLKTFN